MADQKLNDLTSGAPAAASDILYVVRDPSGTPLDRKLALSDVASLLTGSTALTGATVTAASPVLNMAQTWNNAAVTFTGLKANITDTASNAASLLMDLQVGGASILKAHKTRRITFGGADSASTDGRIVFNDFSGADGSTSIYGTYTDVLISTANQTSYNFGHSLLTIKGVAPIAWSSNQFNTTSAADLFIGRRAAANLRLGAADAAAPVAQTLSVQSVVAGTTNTAGANLTITGSQGTGTGTGGSIIFQVAPAGSTGTAQNALATALTIRSSDQGVEWRNFYQDSGVSPITWTLGRSDATIRAASFEANASQFWVSTLRIGGTNFRDTTLSFLTSDAANTLALRNGTNAQTQRVYGTYTDASNYRRLAMTMSTAGVAEIKPEGAGTGASGNVLHISGLPTSNPGPGILWNNAGSVAIGT